MKKLISIITLSSSIFLNIQHAQADWDKYAIENSTQVLLKENPGSGPDWFSAVTKVYQVDSTSSSRTLINTFQHCANYAEYLSNSWKCSTFSSNSFSEYDSKNGKIKILAKDNESKQFIFDLKTNTWTTDDASNYVHTFNKALIKEKTDGSIHIGEDSFVIGNDLIDGAHPIWAEDENGTKVPLNIYGSDLQINGISVQTQIDTNKSNINSLGSGVAGSTALTAALTALPQTSKESKLSCGVGSGAYSSRYAVGFGCASKVNERVDINAGGSYVFGGSKSYGEGTLDSGVIKAGFVFKLGELTKPTQISIKEKEKMKAKIFSLEEKNKQLLARLEKLEKIALSENKSKDLAIYKLK